MNRREFIKRVACIGAALGAPVPGLAFTEPPAAGGYMLPEAMRQVILEGIISRHEMEALGFPAIRTACNQALSTMGELCNERESP